MADDLKSFLLDWEVPLKQFQINPGLFKPLAPLNSKPQATQLNHLTLEWSLTLFQTKTDARVALNHLTTGVPNLGVKYNVMAYRRNQTSGKLTASLREALARTGQRQKGVYRKTMTDAFLQTNEYIFNGNENGDGSLNGRETVKLCIWVHIDERRFHPKNVMNYIIGEYWRKADGKAMKAGVVGTQLWAQAETGELCDVQIDCSGNIVHAHSGVLYAFSELFVRMFHEEGYKQHGWHLRSTGVAGADAMREVLYFVYNRKVSANLQKAPLSQVLEASKLVGVPMGLKLEVERLLTLIVTRPNLPKLWKMAQEFDLKVIQNMVWTRCGNRLAEIKKLEQPDEVTAATAASPELTMPTQGASETTAAATEA